MIEGAVTFGLVVVGWAIAGYERRRGDKYKERTEMQKERAKRYEDRAHRMAREADRNERQRAQAVDYASDLEAIIEAYKDQTGITPGELGDGDPDFDPYDYFIPRDELSADYSELGDGEESTEDDEFEASDYLVTPEEMKRGDYHTLEDIEQELREDT